MEFNPEVNGCGMFPLVQKNKSKCITHKGQKVKMFLTGVKLNWPRLNSYCLIAGMKTGSKNSI